MVRECRCARQIPGGSVAADFPAPIIGCAAGRADFGMARGLDFETAVRGGDPYGGRVDRLRNRQFGGPEREFAEHGDVENALL